MPCGRLVPRPLNRLRGGAGPDDEGGSANGGMPVSDEETSETPLMDRRTGARLSETLPGWRARHFAPDDVRTTAAGIPVKPLYGPPDVADLDYERHLGFPGEAPFTRGAYPTMYRGRPWTMRPLAGYGTPDDTNQRLRFLLG